MTAEKNGHESSSTSIRHPSRTHTGRRCRVCTCAPRPQDAGDSGRRGCSRAWIAPAKPPPPASSALIEWIVGDAEGRHCTHTCTFQHLATLIDFTHLRSSYNSFHKCNYRQRTHIYTNNINHVCRVQRSRSAEAGPAGRAGPQLDRRQARQDWQRQQYVTIAQSSAPSPANINPSQRERRRRVRDKQVSRLNRDLRLSRVRRRRQQGDSRVRGRRH